MLVRLNKQSGDITSQQASLTCNGHLSLFLNLLTVLLRTAGAALIVYGLVLVCDIWIIIIIIVTHREVLDS